MYSPVKLLFCVCVQLGCPTDLSVRWLLTCSYSPECKKSFVRSSSLAVVGLPVGDALSCKLRYCRARVAVALASTNDRVLRTELKSTV